MGEKLVYIIIFIFLIGIVMDYIPRGKKKEIKEVAEEEIKEVEEVNEYDTLTESFEESMSRYRKILDEEFKVKEKIHKDKYDSKKDELTYLEEEVKKLRKFAEEIKLQEKIYKLYNWSRFIKNSPITLLDNLVVDVKEVKGENDSDGFSINFNDKIFTILTKSFGGVMDDGESYGGDEVFLYNSDNKLILQFHVWIDYGTKWYDEKKIRMGDVDIFKNGDWVLDVSLLYENIIKLEKIKELPSKYDTSDIDKIRNNFDINEGN